MSIDVSTAVIGDKAIAEKFVDFGGDLRMRLRRAMADIGRQIAADASSRAPHRTGKLASSIHPKQTETDNRITERIRPTGREGFIGRLMEFGVVNHFTVRNRNSYAGKRLRARRVRALRSEGWYRIAPHPFMSPALAANRARISATLDAAVHAAVATAEARG